MQKAEAILLAAIESAPMPQGLLQQREGPHDIGLDEFRRPVDRAVDMALRSEVHHIARLLPLEQSMQRGPIANIHLLEAVAIGGGLRDRAPHVGTKQVV